MKWYKLLLLSLLSGLLLSVSWYGGVFLVFGAFVPLLFISDELVRKGGRNQMGRGFLYAFPAFLVWNAATTYWIGYCTVAGAVGAILLNTLFMTVTFSAAHACKKQKIPEWAACTLFVTFWMSFEYLHLHWDLTWPWLSLGNVFACLPQVVQWYSATGVFGGTLWILVANILVYKFILVIKNNNPVTYLRLGCALVWILIPVIVSILIVDRAEKRMDKSCPVQAVVVQQNTDPWTEEYKLTNEQQVRRLLDVAGPCIDRETDLVVCPESSVSHAVALGSLDRNSYTAGNSASAGFPLLDSAIAQYPGLNFVLGMSTYRVFGHKASPVAQPVGCGFFVEQYNTAGFYNRNQCVGYYHKCRLVPGVEKMPFPRLFGFLEKAIISHGGAGSSLGTDTVQRVFTTTARGGSLKVGTAICYESVYGELCGRFVRNGANVLAVITNDSWWGDSPGHRQHFEMSRLRAVETRCYVLRAANGGFSGAIDPTGKVLHKTKYGERTAFRQTVCPQTRQTFYVRHGDYMARMAVAVAAAGLAYVIAAFFITLAKRRKTRQNL